MYENKNCITGDMESTELRNSGKKGKRKERFLKVLSFFIPIIGIIFFLIKKKEFRKEARGYLKSAITGVIMWIVVGVITGIVTTTIIKKQKEWLKEVEGSFIVTEDGEDAIVIDGVPIVIENIDDGVVDKLPEK